jgi:hypothetical protein
MARTGKILLLFPSYADFFITILLKIKNFFSEITRFINFQGFINEETVEIIERCERRCKIMNLKIYVRAVILEI